MAGCCAMLNAQQKMASMPFPGHSQLFLESLKYARSMGQDVYVDDTDIPQLPAQAPAAAQADEPQDVGYLNPAGTLFLGMDEAGKGTFIKNPGVIGAWSDSIPCWIWTNQRATYKSIKYLTSFSAEHPSYCEDENYEIDLWGNFCDTIVASGGLLDAYAKDADVDVERSYYWQNATPLQTTKFPDGTEKKYLMLSSSKNPSASDCPLAIGGLPSANTSDGLWPLTNAISTTQSGVSMNLVQYTAADGYVHYLFGSSKYTIDSAAVPNHDMTADSMVYTRINPVRITTHYDKPQAPLYIKSVSLAISSDKYSTFNPKDLKLDTLYLSIQTEKGVELAASMATANDLSNLSYTKGKMLTFHLRDTSAYGELMNEGLLVSEPFRVVISGFKETDNFGIYGANCVVLPTKTEMLYEGGVTKTIKAEPYIMLNGIYPTLENYISSSSIQPEEIGQHGDTISIDMVSYHGSGYQYVASYAKLGPDHNEFAFYSTFKPYDADKRTWLFDIQQPDYIHMIADYEMILSDDEEDPITLWSYYRLFTLHVYASDKPKIGDCIRFGKAGKYIVLQIDKINGQTAVEAISADVKAEKFIRDGQLIIKKGNKTYNVLGIQL